MSDKINSSLLGYKAEEDIALSLRNISGISQKHCSNFFGHYFNKKEYIIDENSICTGLKLYLAGRGDKPFVENDINFFLKPKNTNFWDRFSSRNNYESVAVQSKNYSNEVNFENVNKDIIHILMARDIGFNLKNNTVIVTQRKGDALLESKLKKKYNTKIIDSDIFNEYEIRHVIGKNSISFRQYDAEEDKFINKNLDIGKLAILNNDNFIQKNLKFINLIYIESIDTEENYQKAIFPLNLMSTYLNPNYYLYLAKNGVGKKSERFLEDINAKAITFQELNYSINNGTFFDDYKKLKYDKNFGYGKTLTGQIEQEFKDRIYGSIDLLENPLLTEKNIKNAIQNLLKRSNPKNIIKEKKKIIKKEEENLEKIISEASVPKTSQENIIENPEYERLFFYPGTKESFFYDSANDLIKIYYLSQTNISYIDALNELNSLKNNLNSLNNPFNAKDSIEKIFSKVNFSPNNWELSQKINKKFSEKLLILSKELLNSMHKYLTKESLNYNYQKIDKFILSQIPEKSLFE